MDAAQNATKPLPAPEFIRRAATAWIRAADAGLIDAGELTWLLAHLPSDPQWSAQARLETGTGGYPPAPRWPGGS
jgi:hypothetical protein